MDDCKNNISGGKEPNKMNCYFNEVAIGGAMASSNSNTRWNSRSKRY